MPDHKSDSMSKALIAQAADAKSKAYIPYSKFAVGAAIRARSGRIFTGCNVENISFGLTMCAERVCIGSAISAGESDFDAIAIVSNSAVPVMPCGACRQVMAEFSPSLRVISATTSGVVHENRLDVLLPGARQGILG